MRFLQKMLAAASICLVAAGACATPASPQVGTDYRALEKAQPTDAGKKVEVTEFFWYSCPHCNAFEPALEEWVKKQGDHILFKRVPVLFRETFVPQQKLYYALEALGKSEAMQKKVFHAIHVEHQSLDTDAAIADFIAKQGIDKQKFIDIYNSFAVSGKVKRAAQLQQAYKIDGVPTIAIGGQYLTSPSIVGVALGQQTEPVLQAATLQVMDWLVAKSAKENGNAVATKAEPVKAPAKEKTSKKQKKETPPTTPK